MKTNQRCKGATVSLVVFFFISDRNYNTNQQCTNNQLKSNTVLPSRAGFKILVEEHKKIINAKLQLNMH